MTDHANHSAQPAARTCEVCGLPNNGLSHGPRNCGANRVPAQQNAPSLPMASISAPAAPSAADSYSDAQLIAIGRATVEALHSETQRERYQEWTAHRRPFTAIADSIVSAATIAHQPHAVKPCCSCGQPLGHANGDSNHGDGPDIG